MNIKKAISMLMICIASLSFSFSVFSNNVDSKAVYLVAQISVRDFQKYMAEYGKPVTQLLIEAGAEILAASPKADVVEGEWPANWTVITKFPNREAVDLWYRSDAYKKFKKMRIEELTDNGNIILLPSLN